MKPTPGYEGINTNDGCGFKRKYKNEDQVKLAARELNLRYVKCPRCDHFHLTKGIGKRPNKE